ncbi:MAG: acetyl-CoA carboxylase carboxyltransferase subunit beta [Clostridiales bacterium]|nr:acetyl-CoA carboxylase carboxyltransferase subunit beta [Clostridiales bacterium]
MKLDMMFKKNNLNSSNSSSTEVPEGLLKKCNKCKAAIFADEVKENLYICPKCHGYFRIPAKRRIASIVEQGTFESLDEGIKTSNPLEYKGYEDKISSLREKTGLDEAVTTGTAYIGANKVMLAICDGRFLMASMGYVVGEKITRAIEMATKERLPVIIFACSGGARMQEGIVSLMQMAKTSAALKRHSDEGNLFISVLTDPTTGGVTASFAMLGDIILAEPNALIGFAGPRVIEQTIGEKLPKGFQRSEFLLEHGFIDAIVAREEMKDTLKKILDIHRIKSNNLCEKETKFASKTKKSVPWDIVQISRRKDRPVGTDYISGLFSEFIEFHGDRYYKDDSAIVGGIALFNGTPVTVIAQCKGKNTKDNISKNFGMPSPYGYRKAIRLMKQAEKFNRPIICFVDTPGAFCGLEAEELGQGEAIARNLFEMSSLKTPILSVVTGEGGSGGALAMAVADEVWMLENSVYSILSPEGFAAILWKDKDLAKEAAKVMKMTAGELLSLKVIDGIIPEPEQFNDTNFNEVAFKMSQVIENFLCKSSKIDNIEIANRRYERFRKM